MENIKPLTIDEIYITPFTARRVFNEDGVMSWVPVQRNLNPTGQRHIDYIARCMADGHTDMDWIAERMGCRRSDVNGWIRLMTGLNWYEFRHQYIFRLADDLLRYTSLSVDKIAHRVGCYSTSSLTQQFIKFRHITPAERRQAIRQPRDEGRYRL